ncbi:MAG TPA: O-methyltransferase [Chthoniobacteraceae bacterium]|jgi:predicted O-methyltransferase YrrM|nr:O-methyltransferase [Chthoniobacteraceae bacterium]
MSETTWCDVDQYISDHLIPRQPALEAALAASAAAGLPGIQVSETQGKLLQLLVRMHGARRILELGTLGGYSTLWLAGGLPADGRLVTIEFEEKHAAVARANLARAGLEKIVDLHVGAALDVLPRIAAHDPAPFDFIFIDANKEDYPEYFTWALRLSRKGTVIIADNVVRQGGVLDPEHTDPRVQAVRRLYDLLAAEPRVTATAIQTVGTKGYDGFVMALVIGDQPPGAPSLK